MNVRWIRDRKLGEYVAHGLQFTYTVTRKYKGWRAAVTDQQTRVWAMQLTTLHEALAVCEGHANDVASGNLTPTLHLSIYWAE